jgi:thioredoxin-like negative regulator of GroEL
MASVLNQVAAETKNRAIVGLVPVHDRELVRLFGIRKIPAVFVIRDARVTAAFVGVVPKAKIERLLLGM